MDIRAKARRLKSQIGQLGVVIVDYVQLMTGRTRAENRQVEVSEISRNLKILARELETPVVALASSTDNSRLGPTSGPMLAEPPRIGSIEQDADVVLFLYRDEVYNPERPTEARLEYRGKAPQRPNGKSRLAWRSVHPLRRQSERL